MFKKLISLFILLVLTACNSGSDSAPQTPVTGSGGDGNKPGVVTKTYKWGELDCQQKLKCDDFALNLSVKDWQAVFDNKYYLSGVKPENKSFICGSEIYDSLRRTEYLFKYMEKKDHISVARFIAYVYDLENCKPKENVKELMDEYINQI